MSWTPHLSWKYFDPLTERGKTGPLLEEIEGRNGRERELTDGVVGLEVPRRLCRSTNQSSRIRVLVVGVQAGWPGIITILTSFTFS